MEFISALDNSSRTANQAGRCTHMPSPTTGSFKIVAGNGTSVGTVMILECFPRYRAISGGRISCVQENNVAQWNGGIPECKAFSDMEGFRLAVLLSIVSTGIILLMSIYFITSCLLQHIKKEELQKEREMEREAERLWHQLNAEEQRESFYNHNGRINNNNNNNNNSTSSRLEQHPMCHQKNYPDPVTTHPLIPTVGQMSPTCPV